VLDEAMGMEFEDAGHRYLTEFKSWEKGKRKE